MPLKKIQEAEVSSLHKKGLPTHSSDAAVEKPDKDLPEGEEKAASAQAKKDLPTHPSDASKEEADKIKAAPKKVKPEVDGEKVAEKAAKDGVAEAEEKDGEDPEKDEKKKEEKDEEKVDEAKVEIEVEDDDEEEDEELSDEEKKKAKKEVEEHVSALLSGENLSEEFQKKASTIFEAAVNEQSEKYRVHYKELYESKLESKTKKIEEQLTEEVDGYLGFVVEDYMKNNEVAIEKGIQTEILESLASGLKKLLEDHHIDVPEEKTSLVDELTSKIEKLEADLNEALNEAVALRKTVNEKSKEEALIKATENLCDADAERIRGLAEGVSFDDSESYATKLDVLVENYCNDRVNPAKDISDTSLEDGELPDADEKENAVMNAYSQAISRTVPK